MLLFDTADDQTRVKLKELPHDYINANYVNVRLVMLSVSLKCLFVTVGPALEPVKQ